MMKTGLIAVITSIESFYHFSKRVNELKLAGPIGDIFSDVSRDDEFPKDYDSYPECHAYISEKSRYNYRVIKAFDEAFAFYLERRLCV